MYFCHCATKSLNYLLYDNDSFSFPARFYGPALYPLNARILKFIDTPLKFIEEHSFLGVNRTLQELHVIGSSLEKFPKEAVQILGNLTTLHIRGHKMDELPSNIFVESLAASKIERLEISNGNVYHFTFCDRIFRKVESSRNKCHYYWNFFSFRHCRYSQFTGNWNLGTTEEIEMARFAWQPNKGSEEKPIQRIDRRWIVRFIA